jgi:hypothetical protein
LALSKEVGVSNELLSAPEAARRLDIPTKEVLRLMYYRSIGYEMVNGIAHIPEDALEEYRSSLT